MPSGCLTYGTTYCSGVRPQPERPAKASDAAISFRKSRRSTESSHSERAWRGNSRCSNSSNCGLPARSSTVRQDCLRVFDWRLAATALIEVKAVIEIDEVGQAVNFDRLDGFVGAIALANRLEVGGIIEKHRMTVHAGFRRRNPGNRGSFHARMTVAAVDAVVADVMFVADLYWLLTRNVLPRPVWGARHREHSHERNPYQEKG